MFIRNYEVLNSKAIKGITNLLKDQWGYTEKLSGFLSKENDVFLVTRDIDKIDLTKVKINSLGLYLGEIRHDTLRLSIEGSQIIGKKATKNVIMLDDDQLKQWITGSDIALTNTNHPTNEFVLIKNKDDFYGCGRIKDGVLLNFVPKSRRLHA